jgi:hypothetical protein
VFSTNFVEIIKSGQRRGLREELWRHFIHLNFEFFCCCLSFASSPNDRLFCFEAFALGKLSAIKVENRKTINKSKWQKFACFETSGWISMRLL